MNRKILLIIPILLFVFGVSYAFYEYFRVGESNNEIVAGQIYMKYVDSNTLYLTNVFPETKEEALAEGRTNNEIRFSIKGKNEYKKDIYYEINLNLGDEVSNKKRIRPEDVMIYLECDGEVLIDGVTYAEWNETRIWVNNIPANTLNETTKNYVLKAWVREDILISDSNPNANYTADDWNLSYISLKLSVYGDFVEKEDKSLLANVITDTLTFREDAEGTKYVIGNSDSSNISQTNSEKNIDLHPNNLLNSMNDDDIVQTIDTITDINNYVWYSGKLWRIVSIDKDNNIKLVTEGNITTLALNVTSTDTNYSTSQVHNWLNTEFIKTLANADTLLMDTNWDYATYANFPTQRITTSDAINPEKVGLLSIYDFMMSGGTTSSSTTNTYLKNGYYWWTMSPRYDGNRVWNVDHNGTAGIIEPNTSRGIRPVIVLKSGVALSGDGNGTKASPYLIKGDIEKGTNSSLLNERISGEYIIFNNNKYRIIETKIFGEKKLTKVTLADYEFNKNSLKLSQKFGANDDEMIFSKSYGIGLYLDNWYKATSDNDVNKIYNGLYLEQEYHDMIATNEEDDVVWYTGTEETGYDYTLANSGEEVLATIGLPSYGEMFASQYGDGYADSAHIWLMTRYSSDNNWFILVYGNGNVGTGDNGYGVRPVFYLKDDVKIVSGNGQFNSPYVITQ